MCAAHSGLAVATHSPCSGRSASQPVGIGSSCYSLVLMPTTIMELLCGIVAITLGVIAWDWLRRSDLGRVIQVLTAASAYALWLMVIPVTIYFVVSSVINETAEGRVGTAIFVTLVSLTFIPVFLMALIPWNFFCQCVWRKAGIRLPLSERLAGYKPYQDWERRHSSE